MYVGFYLSMVEKVLCCVAAVGTTLSLKDHVWCLELAFFTISVKSNSVECNRLPRRKDFLAITVGSRNWKEKSLFFFGSVVITSSAVQEHMTLVWRHHHHLITYL